MTYKVREIEAALTLGYTYLTLKDLPDAPSIDEDAVTFAENARKKALGLAQWLAAGPIHALRLPQAGDATYVLADDSGLEVDALGGAPGVHSARFAGLGTGHPGNASDAENNAKLLQLLSGVASEHRTARFRCVIAATRIRHGLSQPIVGETQLFEGACEGSILCSPRGDRGFGYDPLFVPAGYRESFAELGDTVKNRISHRARALAGLKGFLEPPAPKREGKG